MKFGKKKNQEANSQGENSNSTLPETKQSKVSVNTSAIPKHLQPKILLIDLDAQTEVTLRARGYNVRSGTFGKPYRIPKTDGYAPVVAKGSLPEYTEQEIVIIDLATGEPANEPPGEKWTSDGDLDWWISCSNGLVDPRPRIMLLASENFDRILEHGGVFIIFADDRHSQEIQFARKNRYGLGIEQSIPVDNWSFLSTLDSDYLEVSSDRGKEIYISMRIKSREEQISREL